MNAPPAPEGYEPPQATINVPIPIWEAVRKAAESTHPASPSVLVEADRLETRERTHRDPEEGSIDYQILDILAKSDGNLSTHLSRHTLNIMYGEMVRNITHTFTITRKE